MSFRGIADVEASSNSVHVLPAFPIIVIIGNDRHVCFYAFKHQNCESAYSLMHECEDSEWAYHQAELTVPYFICGYSGNLNGGPNMRSLTLIPC
jgi:hypothetical protein